MGIPPCPHSASFHTHTHTHTHTDTQKNKKYTYAIFVIKNGNLIDVVKLAEKGKTYPEFLKDVQVKDGDKDDCRYAVYEWTYQFNPEGAEAQAKSKLFLLAWCPDTAPIKKKMLYSSSFDTLKKAFVGVHKIIQANDESEISQEEVEGILRATDRN